MSRSWCRLYTGTRNHRKIKILRERLPKLWTYWYVLIELAGEIDDGGWIYLSPGVPYTDKELSRELSLRRQNYLQSLCRVLVELQMITVTDKGILLNSFSERNFESDKSTARVQKYREKQKQEPVNETFHRNANVTPQNRTEQNILKETPLPPKRGNGTEEDFEVWWKAYPGRRKQGKPVCLAKWKHLSKTKVLPPLPEMISTLEAQKQSIDWVKNGGEFIPGPLPYLNQSKFFDESIPASKIVSPKARNPDCPRCHGSGLFPGGKMPDGSPAMKPCDCEAKDG